MDTVTQTPEDMAAEVTALEAPGSRTIGVIMTGITIGLLILMFICDLPKFYRDITGKSLEDKLLRKNKISDKKPDSTPQDRDKGHENAGLSEDTESQTSRTADSHTPVHQFRQSDSEDENDCPNTSAATARKQREQAHLLEIPT